MNRYSVFMTYPDQQLVAVEAEYVTHVTTETVEGQQVCHLYAGARHVLGVRADLDDVLNTLRNAS